MHLQIFFHKVCAHVLVLDFVAGGNDFFAVGTEDGEHGFFVIGFSRGDQRAASLFGGGESFLARLLGREMAGMQPNKKIATTANFGRWPHCRGTKFSFVSRIDLFSVSMSHFGGSLLSFANS